MKGKISPTGELLIYREKDYKIQFCPFKQKKAGVDRDFLSCGDWCPHFSEPIRRTEGYDNFWELEICMGKKLVFEDFIDERKYHDVIKEIRKKAKFKDLIEEYFVKSYDDYDEYYCPFHKTDDKPSFIVRRRSGSDGENAKDLHDGKTYDVISFYQAYHKCNYVTALKKLCELTGIEFPES